MPSLQLVRIFDALLWNHCKPLAPTVIGYLIHCALHLSK